MTTAKISFVKKIDAWLPPLRFLCCLGQRRQR